MSDYNTGSAVINGAVNVTNMLPTPSAEQTLKYATFNGSNALADCFTATAGKTAYVLMIVVNQGVAAGAANFYDNAGTLIFSIYNPGANYGVVLAPGSPFIKVNGGEKLKQNCNVNVTSTVFYFEV